MARKKAVDQRAAKEKKQKKIAAVGAVLFVILLIVQVPRTMKMLDDGAAAAPPATTAPAEGAAPPTGAPVDPSTLAPPTLEGANVAPAPGAAATLNGGAQLVSFSQFESKDPFAQQVDAELIAAAAEAKPAAKPAAGGLKPDNGATADAGSEGSKTGSTPTAAPGSATLAVNGAEESVTVKGAFPTSSPVFVLVSVAAKTATIAVAEGGSFAAGGAQLTLELKKPVTLVNTADGSRFVVELLSIP